MSFLGMDWEGIRDRMAASFELSGRFDVVDDLDLVAPDQRLPNTMTSEQYARIVQTYSDIRLGRGDLTIDTGEMAPGSDQELDYRAGVMDDIAAMLQTESGRLTLAALHDNPDDHHATIRAMHIDANGNGDPTDDGNAPLNLGNAGVLSCYPGVSAMGDDGVAAAGGDVSILYNPGVNPGEYMPDIGNPYWVAENPWAPQLRSDVALAHEMAHAVYATAGMKDMRDVTWEDGVPVDASYGLGRREHQGTGLGLYADAPIGENAYRRERRAMAEGAAPGLLPGDASMVERGSYLDKPVASIPWAMPMD